MFVTLKNKKELKSPSLTFVTWLDSLTTPAEVSQIFFYSIVFWLIFHVSVAIVDNMTTVDESWSKYDFSTNLSLMKNFMLEGLIALE